MPERDASRAAIAFALALVLSLVILGLRLNDRDADRVAHRDPSGMLRGFESMAIRVGGAAFATDLAVAPGGEIFFAEHLTGRIGVLAVSDEGVEERTVTEVPLPPSGRLFHLALHPNWPEEPYLYYTAHEGVAQSQRLAVFRARLEGLEAVEITRMVGGLPTEDPARGPEADHYGSALAACDGFLYLSVGDTDSPGPGAYRNGGVRFRAQQVERAEGKILRYRFAGADLEPAGEFSGMFPVFALGLRNVFAMDCDPLTGWPVVVDNGPAGHDQLRLVAPGTNHGWPDSVERLEPTAPLLDSGGAAIAPTGVVARGDRSGVEILLSAFHTRAIYRVRLNDAGALLGPVELLHRASGPVLSMARGVDGCAYFTTADAIWRLDEPNCGDSPKIVVVGLVGSGRFDARPESTYAANCVACHGASREGGAGPSLTDEALTRPDDFYIRVMLEGRPQRGMPAWADAGMTEAQARALLEFLRSSDP